MEKKEILNKWKKTLSTIKKIREDLKVMETSPADLIKINYKILLIQDVVDDMEVLCG